MKPTFKRLTLSPLLIFVAVFILFGGELIAGTTLYFASMMAIAVTCACVTYNTLDGMGSMSGMAFARFALSTLIISQIGKVVLFAKADLNLHAPQVVISVYALFFFSAMLGTMAFSHLRLPLPRIAEPETPTQSRYLYVVALAGGLLGFGGFLVSGFDRTPSLMHGVFLVLSYLLPFSMVLAVDHRIRSTEGHHSIGWMLVWPAAAMEVAAFLYGNRQYFLEPIAICFLTCYVRGFHFGRRHFLGAAAVAVAFLMFVSPYFLYARGGRSSTSPRDIVDYAIQTLQAAPSQWSTIRYQVGANAVADTRTVSYFPETEAVTLNRFALIGPDSTLISVCATGFHYGVTALELDLFANLPRAVYPNKPAIGSEEYLGQLDGQEVGLEHSSYSTITAIADSYGGFDWPGVAVLGFFVLPLVLVVYESMFDLRRPWGTAAAVYVLIGLTEGTLGHLLFEVAIKTPLYLLALSWVTNQIVLAIPSTGDRVVTSRLMNRASTLVPDEE